MKFKKLFVALLLAIVFSAPPAHAIHFFEDGASKGQFVEVDCGTGLDCTPTSGKMKITVGVIGDVTPAAITGTIIIATQYVKTMYYTDETRPASGAPAGTVIAKGSAANRGDCGVVAGGTSFAACMSDGTNWISITNNNV